MPVVFVAGVAAVAGGGAAWWAAARHRWPRLGVTLLSLTLAAAASVVVSATAPVNGTPLQQVLYAMIVGAVMAAAVFDVWRLRIPNQVSMVAFACAAMLWALAGFPVAPVVTAAVVAVGLTGAYVAGWCGAGDVKLIAPVVLAATAAGGGDAVWTMLTASFLLLAVAVTMLPIHISVAVVRRHTHTPPDAAEGTADGAPMGPAILAGLVLHAPLTAAIVLGVTPA